MKEFEIYITDFQRIFIGEIPWYFFIEVIFRCIVFYLMLIGALRLMGRRMAARLSRIEMAAMVSLAAAIGIPLQSPERGILPALVIAVVVIGLELIISYFSWKREKFESLTQDDLDILLEDGVLRLDRMERTRISRERLFAQLREAGLTHLGTLKRVYLEADGCFTIIKQEQAKAGLIILPSWDKDFIAELETVNTNVCVNCGKPEDQADTDKTCRHCSSTTWEQAVIER